MTYYITTPIYYVNGLPHVGSALTTISCDILARYHRLHGEATWFLTGTDENATKVYDAAHRAGVPPLQFVDSLAAAFRSSWDEMHVAFDDFIRTTEPRHVRACQVFFSQLLEKGYVYLDTYDGWYSVSDETFYLDDKVKDGFAIETGNPVVRISEKNYYFKLSAFSDRLLEYYKEHPKFLAPEFRANEVIAFVKEGLRDMCITRTNKGWGIEVPGDPERVIYVWFDALINYLTATGWPDNSAWEDKWPPALHLMGKEIFVRFHATLWPAMLMALDLPLPKKVYAHGWWTARGGSKLGKSTGGLPTPHQFNDLLIERAGINRDIAADAQRYILCREMNFGLDTDFNIDLCLRRFNSDLANDLGNLLNRSLSMVQKYRDIPGFGDAPWVSDPEIVDLASESLDAYCAAMEDIKLNGALESLWRLVGRMNKYIDERAPWNLAKAAKAGDTAAAAALSCTLFDCLEATRLVTLALSPFMPTATLRLGEQLGLVESDFNWDGIKWGGLNAGRLTEPAPVFPRIQDLVLDDAALERFGITVQATAEQIPKEMTAKVTDLTDKVAEPATGALIENVEAAIDPRISIDDFMKVQLRVAEVLAAEPVPNATKLLRLTVQLGEDDTRTILAGIAEHYAPEDLIGRQVVVVANLLPRKMRGIESQGMLLAADIEGRAVLLKPDEPVSPGSRVR